jgi:hypothetical protein
MIRAPPLEDGAFLDERRSIDDTEVCTSTARVSVGRKCVDKCGGRTNS